MNREGAKRRATQLHQSGDGKQEAERLYREILLESDDIDIAINLGALLRGQGRLKEGMRHYKVWIPKIPQNNVLRQNGINCAIESGELNEGEKWAREGIDLDRNNIGFQIALVKIYRATERNEYAAQLIEKVLKEYEVDVDTLLEASVVYKTSGKVEMALSVLERAEELISNDDARPLSNRLSILMDENRIGECIDLIEQAKETIKFNPILQAIYAQILIKIDRLEEAYKILTNLCDQEPLNANHWLNKGACLRGSKYTIAAARAIKKQKTQITEN